MFSLVFSTLRKKSALPFAPSSPVFVLAALLLALAAVPALSSTAAAAPLKTEEIRVRDPYIYADHAAGVYYLYAQAANREGSTYQGVEVYTSADLKAWSAPRPVLVIPPDAGVSTVWAPEMHAYRGAYYLFVTLTFHETLPIAKPVDSPKWPAMHRRGTWIFRAASPSGPFEPLRIVSHTAPGIMALDGTLFVDPDGTPQMVYCHEWVELIDGTMAAVRLTPDLRNTVGKPELLFRATDAPGARTKPTDSKVTDGPFLYRSEKTGALYMIWSTFIPGKGYCVFQTLSESGRVAGPWGKHMLLYEKDGGHGMIFKTFDGQLMLALHQPNSGAPERLRLLPLEDTGSELRLK